MNSLTADYKDDLLQDLRDPENCAEYLKFCQAESNETFLLGLRNVAEAQGGMTKLAAGAQVNRENLYRMLSGDGNPRLDTLSAIVGALGLELSFTAIKKTKPTGSPRHGARIVLKPESPTVARTVMTARAPGVPPKLSFGGQSWGEQWSSIVIGRIVPTIAFPASTYIPVVNTSSDTAFSEIKTVAMKVPAFQEHINVGDLSPINA